MVCDSYDSGFITMMGDVGDDTLLTYGGDASMSGGAGTDTFKFFHYMDTNVTITDWDEEDLVFYEYIVFDWDEYYDIYDEDGYQAAQAFYKAYEPSADDLMDHAEIVGSDTVITILADYEDLYLTIEGVTDLDLIAGHIMFT